MRRIAAFAVLLAAPAAAQSTFTNFESPQVHPLEIGPGGTRLFAANTADGRLSVFDLAQPSSPKLVAEIPVGVEPISVRARTDDEVWVVNHTSDSVSVVSVSQGLVLDTISVKDEPCDVVFAGSPQRAFVSVARSNEVRVFDPLTRALVATIPVFGETPQSLAVSADGTKVYAAFNISGNRTTSIPASLAPPQPDVPGLVPSPAAALIVDATDPAWAPSVIGYTIPDHDVAEISTAANAVTRYFDGVGTILFGVAVQPGTGDLFVTATDARNLIRHEPNLRGHFVDNLVSRIESASGAVTKVDLNPGIDYGLLPNPAALATSLAQPVGVAFHPSGSHLWVAAFGTDRVAKLSPAGAVLKRIEIGPATGTAVDPRTKRGPRGLALHAPSNRLYVQNRISNTITVVATDTETLLQELPVGAFNPEHAVIRQGRGFLYDAKLSGNGTASCAACHIDGDTDFLAWDLGNPNAPALQVPDPAGITGIHFMHPMKGPMVTQTLRALTGTSPLHWRGDRADFFAFNPTFDGLLGGSQIATEDMSVFHGFVRSMSLEPNPNLKPDNSLPALLNGVSPAAGKLLFQSFAFDAAGNACVSCHILPTTTVPFLVLPGQLQAPQSMDVPHLRSAYRKTGFTKGPGPSRSGFGFSHDGTESSVFEALSKPIFPNLMNDSEKKRQLEAFVMCVETGAAPAVGHSRTLTPANATQPIVVVDVGMLQGQAALDRIDLVAKGRIDGQLRGLLYDPGDGKFHADKAGVGPFTWLDLKAKALAGNAHLTFVGAPPGSGARLGVDRNLDGVLDGDEPPVSSVESFGAPSQICGGAMLAGVNSAPSVGNAVFAITCESAKPGSIAAGILGSSPLPSGFPIFGVSLWVDPLSDLTLVFPLSSDASGFAIGKLPIPGETSLVGFTFYSQVIGISDCALEGLAGSQGLKITLID